MWSPLFVFKWHKVYSYNSSLIWKMSTLVKSNSGWLNKCNVSPCQFKISIEKNKECLIILGFLRMVVPDMDFVTFVGRVGSFYNMVWHNYSLSSRTSCHQILEVMRYWLKSCLFILKFDICLWNSAAEAPAKFQSDKSVFIIKSRSFKTSWDVLLWC